MLVGNHIKEINVPTYDWTHYFEKQLQFQKITNILQYHHFRLSKDHPGVVKCLKSLDDDEPFECSIFANRNPPNVTAILPKIVPPKGFTIKRADYLRKEIRQFCKPGTEDLVAP